MKAGARKGTEKQERRGEERRGERSRCRWKRMNNETERKRGAMKEQYIMRYQIYSIHAWYSAMQWEIYALGLGMSLLASHV
jgi:hypothetical protein